MSGPIVRKYGFPNHEKIFGKKEVEHGAPESGPADSAAKATTEPSEAKKKKPKKAK